MSLRKIITFIFAFALVAGCGSKPIEVTSIDRTEGPETGGTTIKIIGNNFDQKGVIVTFSGVNATNVRVLSPTEIAVESPAGDAGESVRITIANSSKADQKVELDQLFTYTDATAPKITKTEPSDGSVIGEGEYEDSLNVMSEVSITFNEGLSRDSGSLIARVEKPDGSLAELAGQVRVKGDRLSFTSDKPMRAGRTYHITISGIQDLAGNTLSKVHKFSFSIAYPKKVDRYRVRKGDTLWSIASRPEVYDDGGKWPRFVVEHQDDYDFDRNLVIVGQWLRVPRGKVWGDR